MSMKILHVITSLETGGAETLVVNLLPRLHDLGHEVGLVVFYGNQTMLMDRLETLCPSCRIYKFGQSYYNPLYIFKLIRIMRRYDIVHTHNSSPQLYTAIANVFCKKKIITTEHNTFNRRRKWKWYVVFDRWMYHKYNDVICISNQAEENLRNYLYPDSIHIETIFNGIDIANFHDTKPATMSSNGKFIVIMVAAFRKQKDQDTLIKAIAKLPQEEFELWLVGDGERREELKKLVSNQKVEDDVRFLGVRSDVANVLKAADVVVMSSHWEGLSLSNIEGMSVGKPFVASDVDGLREITKDAGILFKHEDADELASIILRLSNDKEYYDFIAARCYERAKQYDISKTVEGYNRVYQSLANG